MSGTSPPTGTVTFLFTDVEGSTRLWEERRPEMEVALERHDAVLRDAIDGHGGYVFSTAGDSFAAAFARADEAVAAAVAAQRGLAALEPSEDAAGVALRVRMAVLTGEAHERGGDYFGPALNRAARLMGSAHGGQVLVADSTSQILRGHLPDGLGLIDLGEIRLLDVEAPERVWQVAADGLDTRLGPLRTTDDAVGNLRLPPTTFVGRGAELPALSKELTTARLVTVTGVGGGGKTRLAFETAAAISDEFPDGVWVCELAPIENATAVAAALAEVLGVRPQPGLTTTEAIVDRFARQRVLVILDNCEHVLEAAGDLAGALLAGCGELKVLATSREPLGVAGEHVWPIPALDAEFDAVELFCVRATAADATFAPDQDDRETIAEICRRLDGLPLSIELAAARIQAFTPADIAERLDDGFRLLRAGRGDAGRGGRHQNLEAVIDWSYRLLDDQQRRVFERLAVFAGGFDANAVEAVCAGDGVDAYDVVDILAELVVRSLVTASRQAGHTRYAMLETLRQYGQRHLDEHDQTAFWRQNHLEHYIRVADRADEQLTSTGWDEGTRIFEYEWDNLRTALAWAIDNNDLTQASRLIEYSFMFAEIKLRREHNDWAHQVLDLADEHGIDYPPAVAGAAASWGFVIGDFDALGRLADAGLDAAPSLTDPATHSCWQAKSTAIVLTMADLEDHEAIKQALDQWDRVDDRPRDRFHRALCAWLRSAWLPGDQAEHGVAVLEQLAAATANPALQIWLESARGQVAHIAGRYDEAIDGHRRALELAQRADQRFADATSAANLVRALADSGRPLEHAPDYATCLQITHHHRLQFELSLGNLARHLHQQGHAEPATTVAGHTNQLRSVAGYAGLYQDLDDAANQDDIKCWQQAGAGMDTDQILDYALRTLAAIQTPTGPT